MPQVIEWVENTTPLVDYISDSKTDGCAGLHSRMFPGEWGFRYCRDYLDKAKREEKRKAFDEICRHHSPVFRFFFVELFGRCPQSWYVAKKKYSRSVAVSSFVGHILGIGDRHGSNILIHKGTGEVVHIDFGIVFEQGKVSTQIASFLMLSDFLYCYQPKVCPGVEYSRKGSISFNPEYC